MRLEPPGLARSPRWKASIRLDVEPRRPVVGRAHRAARAGRERRRAAPRRCPTADRTAAGRRRGMRRYETRSGFVNLTPARFGIRAGASTGIAPSAATRRSSTGCRSSRTAGPALRAAIAAHQSIRSSDRLRLEVRRRQRADRRQLERRARGAPAPCASSIELPPTWAITARPCAGAGRRPGLVERQPLRRRSANGTRPSCR